jgi:cytochrome P450
MDVYLKGGPGGVVTVDGEIWRDQRRFAIHLLRDLGLGKNLMQERVLDEVAGMIDRANKAIAKDEKDVDLPAIIDIAVGSVINAILFGYRWDESRQEEFYELKRLISQFIREVGTPAVRMALFRPYLFSRLPYFKPLMERVRHSSTELSKFYQRQIEEHLAQIDVNSDALPADYAEAFLREKAKLDKNGDGHFYSFHQLRTMCSDLFLAGQETTSTTLAWGVAYLIHSPADQQKLHVELDKVIGSDRLVTIADRANLPFTNAVICEMQRMCNLLPQNVPHRATKDTTIDGYFIPKDTLVIPQISVVLYDEKLFPEPRKFNPMRFIDESGRLKRTDEMVAFSLGKRQCLGEGLARMELFLFLANLFNQYKVLPGSEPPSLERKLGATVQCPPFRCHLQKRH